MGAPDLVGGGENEPFASSRGATDRRGGGGGTGLSAGGGTARPGRTGGGGADGGDGTGRDGNGGGAATERRGAGGAALVPEPLERRGGLGLPGLGLSSDMSGGPYATNASGTRKAL